MAAGERGLTVGAAEVGQISLGLAFTLTFYQLAASVLGLRWRLARLLGSARNATVGIAALLTLVSSILIYALLAHDFSLKYVWEVSSRAMPWDVTLFAFWGGQPGSLLFWAWGLSLLSAVAVWRSYRSDPFLAPYMGATLAGVQVFFLFLLAFVSSPFERLPLPASDGRGLNPLLWDDGMRIHPPLLLAGYMSFSVPFALAMAALITGRLDRAWLGAARRWMLLAWAIQGAGLLAGAWWAYHVLGWGGYWGWDPVENAALLPWLAATAFLHSIRVQEQRGMLKLWNLALVITTFALAIFGTFVVRSGVISSVHSFALSAVGPYFFGFLGIVLIGSLGLFLYRLPQLRSEGEFDALASREAGFLVNNLLLSALVAATFWGTIFPLLSEAFRGMKMAVGPPFYQQVTGPLLLGLLVLMGIGPLLAWRQTSASSLGRHLRWPLAAWVAAGLVSIALGVREGLAIVAFGACAFVVGTIVVEYSRGVGARRRSTNEGWTSALLGLVARDQRRYGGYLVHLAMVLIAVGVIGSQFFKSEGAATLQQGESLTVGRYTLTHLGLLELRQPGVQTVLARMDVREGSRSLAQVAPERRIHAGWETQPTTGVAISTTWPWAEDLYVLLTGWEDGAASLRVLVNPFVIFIWVGGAAFLLGTLVAGWPIAVARPTPAVVPVARPREVVASEA